MTKMPETEHGEPKFAAMAKADQARAVLLQVEEEARSKGPKTNQVRTQLMKRTRKMR